MKRWNLFHPILSWIWNQRKKKHVWKEKNARKKDIAKFFFVCHEKRERRKWKRGEIDKKCCYFDASAVDKFGWKIINWLLCLQRQLWFCFSLHSAGFKKGKKNFDIYAEISTIINININCRMKKKRWQRFLKTQSGKVFAQCYCSLFILWAFARCVYNSFWSYFIWPFLLSHSTQSIFSVSHSSLIHSFSRLFALNFIFIHYINSFLIEIFPSEFRRIPTLVHHRWLVYFHKQHIAWPRKVARPKDTFGFFFRFIFEYDSW